MKEATITITSPDLGTMESVAYKIFPDDNFKMLDVPKPVASGFEITIIGEL